MASVSSHVLAKQAQTQDDQDMNLRLVIMQGMMITRAQTAPTKALSLSKNFYQTFLDWVFERIEQSKKPLPDELVKTMVRKRGREGFEIQVVYLSAGKRYAMILFKRISEEFLGPLVRSSCKKLYIQEIHGSMQRFVQDLYECNTRLIPLREIA